MCVCVCACVRACTFVRVCMRDVFEIYDNNISPRLIMIIIKIIILYFIQIRHTDDVPSMSTRLVQIIVYCCYYVQSADQSTQFFFSFLLEFRHFMRFFISFLFFQAIFIIL